MKITHIAVIDDDNEFRELLSNILREEGYEVSQYPDNSCLEALQDKVPDLFLIDVWLDQAQTSNSLITSIQKSDVLKNTPIVVMSSDPLMTEYFRRESFRKIFLQKPFSIDTLLRLFTQADLLTASY
jgi:DNA-binding NtrC family response regulator